MEFQSNNPIFSRDVSGLQTGTYHLVVRDAVNQLQTACFVKGQ